MEAMDCAPPSSLSQCTRPLQIVTAVIAHRILKRKKTVVVMMNLLEKMVTEKEISPSITIIPRHAVMDIYIKSEALVLLLYMIRAMILLFLTTSVIIHGQPNSKVIGIRLTISLKRVAMRLKAIFSIQTNRFRSRKGGFLLLMILIFPRVHRAFQSQSIYEGILKTQR